MQNEIYDKKNGLTYMLCGDYYLPELALTDIEPTYGKYGMLRKSYLQEHRKAKYQILLLQGKLVEHLNQIDAEARDRTISKTDDGETKNYREIKKAGQHGMDKEDEYPLS